MAELTNDVYAVATLSFNLASPDGERAHREHLWGPALLCIVGEIDEYLRQLYKYGEDAKKGDLAAEIRQKLHELLTEEGIDIHRG